MLLAKGHDREVTLRQNSVVLPGMCIGNDYAQVVGPIHRTKSAGEPSFSLLGLFSKSFVLLLGTCKTVESLCRVKALIFIWFLVTCGVVSDTRGAIK